MLPEAADRGTAFAPDHFAVRAATAAVVGVMLQSCVITRGLEYQAPADLPPSVEDTSTADLPMTQVITWPQPAAADGGLAPAGLSLRAVVREPNQDQEVLYKVFIDYNPDDPVDRIPVREGRLGAESDDTPFERDVEFTVSGNLLEPGCHRIDLVVSGAFLNLPGDDRERTPVIPGDIGVGTWWVASGEDVDMRSCP